VEKRILLRMAERTASDEGVGEGHTRCDESIVLAQVRRRDDVKDRREQEHQGEGSHGSFV
jgi:hypothetical protein